MFLLLSMLACAHAEGPRFYNYPDDGCVSTGATQLKDPDVAPDGLAATAREVATGNVLSATGTLVPADGGAEVAASLVASEVSLDGVWVMESGVDSLQRVELNCPNFYLFPATIDFEVDGVLTADFPANLASLAPADFSLIEVVPTADVDATTPSALGGSSNSGLELAGRLLDGEITGSVEWVGWSQSDSIGDWTMVLSGT